MSVVSTVTTLASICKHCYHIGKCPSVSLTHRRVCTTCETSQVLLAGVSGGFPGVLPFGPTYGLARPYEWNNLERDIKLNPKKKKSTVTTLVSICQYCHHIGKCLSILLPNRQVYVNTITTLARVCLYFNNTGKDMSAMLPHWKIYVSTVTTQTSICLYCYHISECMLASICQYCYIIGKRLCIL